MFLRGPWFFCTTFPALCRPRKGRILVLPPHPAQLPLGDACEPFPFLVEQGLGVGVWSQVCAGVCKCVAQVCVVRVWGECDVCAGVAGILCVHGCARCVCADVLSVTVRGVCAGWRGHCGGPASSWPSRGPPLRGPADPRAGCCQASGRIREPPGGEAGPCLDIRKGRGCPAQTRSAAGFLSRGGHLGPLGHQLSPPLGDCSPLPASQLHLCGSERASGSRRQEVRRGRRFQGPFSLVWGEGRRRGFGPTRAQRRASSSGTGWRW